MKLYLAIIHQNSLTGNTTHGIRYYKNLANTGDDFDVEVYQAAQEKFNELEAKFAGQEFAVVPIVAIEAVDSEILTYTGDTKTDSIGFKLCYVPSTFSFSEVSLKTANFDISEDILNEIVWVDTGNGNFEGNQITTIEGENLEILLDCYDIDNLESRLYDLLIDYYNSEYPSLAELTINLR